MGITTIRQKMLVQFKCQNCGEAVFSKEMEQQKAFQAMNVQRSNTGTPMLLGNPLTKNVRCKCCNFVVVNVESKIGRGSFGSFSITSVRK